MNNTNILIRNGMVPFNGLRVRTALPTNVLATIGMNLSYYGFALSTEAFKTLQFMSEDSLASWWAGIEPELKNITGDDRNMGDFVVYKNFPQEVLDMSEGEYWFKQICMYWGVPNEYFTQEEQEREEIDEEIEFKVLKLAYEDSLGSIYTSLLSKPTKWTRGDFADVKFLSQNQETDFSKLTFKENFVKLATLFIEKGYNIKVSTATDVMRLAAGLSDQDVSLREKVRFKKFPRSQRRYFLGLLENCTNLREDIARRKETWKRFLFGLHAGDYGRAYPKVLSAVNDLYSGQGFSTFNSSVEAGLARKDASVLSLLKTRPGEFRRRLAHCADIFGTKVIQPFEDIVSKLSTSQLVALRRHLETTNTRETRAFPPRGNWSKLQVSEPRRILKDVAGSISTAIGGELKNRLANYAARELSESTKMVKLPNNDNELSPYGRGTRFPIPEDVNFIRTASYWQTKGRLRNIWYDNGWNFFDDNWRALGTCCWNVEAFHGYRGKKAAIFSGDPTNSKEMEGRACQMIDLYLDRLAEKGVRYAVWNVLCFSNQSFDEADEVFAALQWGANPQKGKLFEPSRCQLSFPLHGENMTKYICYIDVAKREMVYMDANLRGAVNSAASNQGILSETMPAFVDYLEAQPSVYDLFRDTVDAKNGTSVILYSDKEAKLEGELAYVFRPENPDSEFESLDLNEVLQHG
jgi:hypothetical protein